MSALMSAEYAVLYVSWNSSVLPAGGTYWASGACQHGERRQR